MTADFLTETQLYSDVALFFIPRSEFFGVAQPGEQL